MKPLFVFILGLLLANISKSNASNSVDLSYFFYAICLNTQANTERISSFARLGQWPNIPDEVLNAFVPERRPEHYAGWFAPDVRAFIIVARGADGSGRRYRSCSVFFRDSSPREVINELLRRYNVNNASRRNDGFQTYVAFRISVLSIVHDIFVSYASAEEERGTLKLNTIVFE